MAWIELTVHWIVSDCGLGEVSVYTPSKGCVRLRVYGLHTGVRDCEHVFWIIRVED